MKALALLAIALWLAITLLPLACDGNVPKLPAVSAVEVAAGACALRAARFYGDPRDLSAEQKVQLGIDLLECVRPALAGADAGAQ